MAWWLARTIHQVHKHKCRRCEGASTLKRDNIFATLPQKMSMLVSWPMHHFEPDTNISTTVRWMIHCHQRMKPTDSKSPDYFFSATMKMTFLFLSDFLDIGWIPIHFVPHFDSHTAQRMVPNDFGDLLFFL